MRRRKEQSLIDAFFNYLNRVAVDNGRVVTRCSMDGQDSILGADYIFTNSTRFVLVEFKYEKIHLKDECKKNRRLHLCQALDTAELWRQLSLECHFVAWSEMHERRVLNFNQYYPEICNREIFGVSSGLHWKTPDVDTRMRAGLLAEEFLQGTVGAEFDAFEQYTNWLLELEGQEGGDIELLIDNPDSNTLEFLEFQSVGGLKQWLDHTTLAPPPPRPKPKPYRGFGP